MKRMGLLPLALAAALAAGCDRKDASTSTAQADNPGAVGTAGSGVRGSDNDLVRDAAVASTAEVELGRLALERASDPGVKKFAQMMIDDHTKGGEALKTAALRHNLEVPAQVDEKHAELRDKLATKQGLEFDKSYMEAMVEGHEDMVNKLESRIDRTTLSEWKTSMAERMSGNDAKVKAVAVVPEKSDNPITMSLNQWAADTYPVAYAHREAAKTLLDAVKKKSTD
jgi:putative membrane protein